jgi:hypothetical protein
MDLRKHETFRIGLRLNLFFLDIPSAKTTIYFGWSVYGARVPVIKPITENQPVQNKFITNTFEHGPELAAELFTDERYGLRISGAFKWYYAFTDQFQQVSNSVEFSESPEIQDVTPGEPGYWKFSMLAYLKPKRDGKGKIFFRYNYFSPYKSIDLAWSQIQLGYAFSLTSTELPASLK